MITQLERLIMNIQDIINISPYKVSPLVEYNGRMKLAFYQSDGQLHFILNYHYQFGKIMADIDIYFNDINNTELDLEMKKVLIQILLELFESGNHQAISCNVKITQAVSTSETISLFQREEMISWQSVWEKIGYDVTTKITDFQTSNTKTYSSNVSILWKKQKSLGGELFYYFYHETSPKSFQSIHFNQIIFQDSSIEIAYDFSGGNGNLVLLIEQNNIIIKDARTQQEIYICDNIHTFNYILRKYFDEQISVISMNTEITELIYIKQLIQRCIGEIPFDKLEYFAHQCFQLLQEKFPSFNPEEYIKEHLDSFEIYPITERIVAISFCHYLLCVAKTSNLSWMSQKNIEFTVVENT